MSDLAGFAGAITIREHVLRTALQAAYANGSDAAKTFSEDLSGDGVGVDPTLFLGQPGLDCEGATNSLVVTLPMWGQVTVSVDLVAHVVGVVGEMELTLSPTFRTGPAGSKTESSLVLDQIGTTINARRWSARVTSPGTPVDVAAFVTGEEFRTRFGAKFRDGVIFGQIDLPSIDASFLGSVTRKSSSVAARVRDGVLLIGLNYVDANHSLTGDPEVLTDFARSDDVAGLVHPDAIDVLLDDVHRQLVDGVEGEGATLDNFSVTPGDGHFRVSGTASTSEGSVDFSFRVVPSMFHTRPGAYFGTIGHMNRPVRAYSRTWPALEFSIEGVETSAHRSWWVIVFGEVILGVLTVGMSIIYIEGMVSAAAANFSGRIESSKPGAATARIQRTIAPPGGVNVRVGLEKFDVTESGLRVGISVHATPSAAALYGPTTVPETYRHDTLRYILRLPSGAAPSDPGLRVHWNVEDRTNNVTVQDTDGPAAGRLRIEFSPTVSTAIDFGVVARLYRQLGPEITDLGTQSVNLHLRPKLAPGGYVRWRWQGSNPQLSVDPTTDTWRYKGVVKVDRYSEWHRTDAPCLAVNAPARYRYQEEKADRLPFSLRLLENHRKGLCPYCFFGGPAGISANL